MKRCLCLPLLLALLAGCQQVPAGEPAKEPAAKESPESAAKAVVLVARVADDEPRPDPASWVKVGQPVNVVVEEAGESPGCTLFEAARVAALEDRGKDGLAVTVYLTPAQVKAWDALKGGKVSVEPYKPDPWRTKGKK